MSQALSVEVLQQASQGVASVRYSEVYVRFWGTSVLCNFGLLVTTNHLTDVGAATLAILMSPVVALALALVYRPIIKALTSPADVVIRLADRVVKSRQSGRSFHPLNALVSI